MGVDRKAAWSLFKRSVNGSYHSVSAKRLEANFDELELWFNNRENPFLFRDDFKKLFTAEKLSSEVPTSNSSGGNAPLG